MARIRRGSGDKPPKNPKLRKKSTALQKSRALRNKRQKTAKQSRKKNR